MKRGHEEADPRGGLRCAVLCAVVRLGVNVILLALAVGACSSDSLRGSGTVTAAAAEQSAAAQPVAEQSADAPVPPTSTDPPPPVMDPVEVRRATRLRGIPAADADAPAVVVTPGANIPNPFVLVDGGRYHMYSSQVGWYEPNLEYRHSPTFRSWPTEPVSILPDVPGWATPGFTWAPDVRRIGDRYVLYMTARQPVPEIQCIGAAVADHPAGPFVAIDEQIVCQPQRLGSIDPRTFVDAHGALWLHWKSDDNADTEGTTTSSIYAQPLAPDGLSLLGEPVRILEVDQPWEGRIVEAPQMMLLDDEHWLFYSGNWFNQPAYAIGVARCEGPAGPCTKPYAGPLVASNEQGLGPGEQSLFVDLEGRLWMVYSPVAQDYTTPTDRPVALARIGLSDTGPYLADPAFDPDG